MSLDVDLLVTQPCSVYTDNITHNLGKMAAKVELSNGGGSYEGLCDFVYKYRNACWDTPEVEIRISR